ncbi:rhomboid family intramembrane serine protease [Dethiothermospora halolimnae]|uniref:rhomboid family intramembrane serine protease n=1 Tax=Dethiothermospora halolimnae TaxID=3114390 RepID=UPI003CCB8948
MKIKLNKIKFNSPIILTFTLLSFIVLIISQLTDGEFVIKYFSNYKSSLTSPLTYFRTVSHVLGHANFQHWFYNISLLLVIGSMLEEKYGSFIIAEAILITALVTGIFNMLFSSTALLGASGVVFMMIVLSSISGIKDDGEVPLSFILVLIMYIGREVYNGIVNEDNISQLTHIIGGLSGAVLGFVYNIKNN